MSQPKNLDVSIMGRDFRIAVPEEEEASLRQAVEYIDGKMQAIKDGGKVVGIDRIAILAALNVAHELLHTKVAGDFDIGEFKRRIGSMQDTIDQAMLEQNRLF